MVAFMSADLERARLEAIVFGRVGTVDDAEQRAASEELARLLDAEAEELSDEPHDLHELQADQAEPAAGGTQRSDEDDPMGGRRRVVLAVLAGVLAVALGAAIVNAVLGRPLGDRSDSTAIFDQPQTEEDLRYPDNLDYGGVIAESVRFVGSKEGYDVFVYLQDPPVVAPMFATNPPPTRTPEPPAETTRLACMLVVVSASSSTGWCGTPEEFAAGVSVPFTQDGVRAEVSWNIDDGLAVVAETLAPVAPAVAVFEEEQDDADLDALLYLPDVPAEQQASVRFLGHSGDHYLAAFRDADGSICLAVYDATTTLATSESSCVSIKVFERDGIELLYPSADPTVAVKWGPSPGFTVGGR
jgi:hypothetical protein